jgi:hypothetical protein
VSAILDYSNQDAVDFLRQWHGSQQIVLTSIIPDGKTTTHTFTNADDPDLHEWIGERQGIENLYFHVNPMKRALSSKAAKEDVARLAWLHVDVDPRVTEEPEADRQRILKMLQGASPPFTVIVDSGGGYQGFYKLDAEPKLDINGLLSRAQELEAYNLQLERIHGGDHCHNCDRIMRIPGTVNVPNARKAKKGRVPTVARLVSFSDASYPISAFTPAVRVQTSAPGLSGGQPKIKITGNVPVVDCDTLRAWAAENGKTISDHTLAVIATGTHPIDAAKYPSRSEALFAVCCDLVRAGLPEEMIYAVITGPNEIASSVREKRGSHEYALRQIERAMEEAVDPWLRKLNELHAVIGDIGGKCRIISEVYDPVMQRTRVSKATFEDFRNRYNNVPVQVGVDQNGQPMFKPLGIWWTLHPQRRQFDNIVFAPNQELERSFNLWKGFTVEAIPGNKHQPLLDHILNNICSGNEEHFNYLIGWLARLVQDPGCPGEVAVCMRGKRGTGKSLLVKIVGKLFGRHFLPVSDSKHLVGSFNSHLRDVVLLFGDEAFFAGDKRHESVLKTLITEDTLIIEGKGVDAEAAMNFVHLFLASNEDWVVPAGLDERRFFVLEVGDGQRQNSAYFGKLMEDMNGGGYENLLHFLLSYDLSNYEVRKVPQTRALLDQKILSMGPDMQWFHERLVEGKLIGSHDRWEGRVLKQSFYEEYINAMLPLRRGYNHSPTTFARFLQRCCPPGTLVSKQEMADVPIITDNGAQITVRRRAYVNYFPPLDVMRKFWDDHMGGPHDWPKWEGAQEGIDDHEDKTMGCPF